MLEESEVSIVASGDGYKVSLEGIGSPDIVAIHVEITKPFTLGDYKEYLLIFDQVKLYCKNLGYSKIVTANDEHDDKMIKFWEMFGFDVYEHGPGIIGYAHTEVL